MSAYQAKISLIVEGEQKIKSLQDRVNNLSKQITELKKLDIGGVFEDPVTSGAVSKLRKVRQDEAKATDGIIKGQRLLNNSTEYRLMQQIKLNAAVDLYTRRVNELGRTSAGDQKQFQARIQDIQKGFEFFKGKGSVQGVQAVATELGRIVEYSREVNRLETGRIRSQEQLRGYSAEIAKYKALGLNTNKAETTFDKLAVNAGTNKYALAEKYNIVLGKRLRILKDEATAQKQEANRVEKLQFRPSSPIQGAVDIIGSPINKQMGTQAAVALEAFKLKTTQAGTRTEVSAVQSLQAQKTKALQDGTRTEVAAVQSLQAQKTKALQDGTRTEVAAVQSLQAQKTKILQDGTRTEVAAVQSLQAQKTKILQDGTRTEVAAVQSLQAQKTKALQDGTRTEVAAVQSLQAQKTKILQDGTRTEVAAVQSLQAQKTKALQDGTRTEVAAVQSLQAQKTKALQDGTKAEVALAQQKQKAADQQKKAGAQRAESIALGVGFPLMFGAGPASVAGSLAGSFAGSGFGGQILGGALGAAIDKLGVAAIQTGKSLASLIEGFEKLKEANLFASKSQEFYIQKLIETGRIAEATGAIQAQIIKKLGVSGYNDLTALANASNDLSKAWADFNLQLQAAVAGPLEGLLTWLTEVVRLSTSSTQQQAERLDPAAFADAQMKAIGKTSKFGFGGNAAAYNKELDRLSSTIVNKNIAKVKPTQTTKLEDLNTIEAGIKAAEQQADIIKDAYRTGFRLQQQGIDLQRQGSDLQRRVAQDVYNKQQEILRLQVDNDRQRKQVAIEMVDLEYRRRISNEEGRVAAVLEAEAALMKTKAEGEANIEAKKRLLELDIDKQKRETENYIFELGRTIDGIRRATLNYEMDVADYRLGIERKIGEQRRVEEAGQAAGAPATRGMGKAIEYFTGDPKLGAAGGYRADHGGSNYHDHIAYKTAKEAKEAAALLNRSGIKTTELKGVNPVGGHAPGSYHYSGQAFDVPGAQVPVGQEPALSAKVRKILQMGTGAISPVSQQLTTAQSPIKRPVVSTPNVAGVQAGMESYNEKNAALRKEALSIEQQLQNLREQAALDSLAAVARGFKEIQQRKDALAYAKAELGTIGAGNQDLQERLAFEAQSGVKLKIYQDANNDILAKTKLQGEERKKLELELATGLEYTKQQIALDKEALVIAQQTRFEKEKAGIQAQLGVTGKGLQAGFIGQAGQAYESEMLKSGNVAQAQALATQTQALELATTKARALESAYQDIGSATASLMTEGVAGLVAGTTTAQQIFSDFLKSIGQILIQEGTKMIATYIAIAIAKSLAGLSGGGSSGGLPSFGDGGGFGSFEGGAFGTASGGLGGGDFTSFLPGKSFYKAAGGPVSSNSTYMVGEKGPELFVPSAAGTIIPADATAAMARYQRQGGGGDEPDPVAAMARYQRQDGNFANMGSNRNTTNNANSTTNNGYDNNSDTVNNIQTSPSPVLALSFETTRFLGQDYVSTDQLQAAMLATEKRAAASGAKAGAAQVAAQMRNSPGYRRQVGLR